MFSKVHNSVTGRDEELEFKRLRKDLWETGMGRIDYLNLIFDATLGEKDALAKVRSHASRGQVHGSSVIRNF